MGLRFVPVIFHSIDEEEVLQRMADAAILRRSLTKGQRAAITLEFSEMVEELRKEAGENKGTRTDLSSDLNTGCTTKEVMESLSEKTGVGKTSMYLLQAVQRDAPDLFELVKAGKMSINKAYTTKKDREEGEGEK